MSHGESVDLESDRRDSLLGDGGVGILSFGTDGGEPPHSIPVSYGYDAETGVFYFRLAVGPESAKGEVDGRAATVVIHGTDEGHYWSVVAQGTLVPTDEDPVATASLAGLERVEMPLVDAFDGPIEDVTFAFTRLDPDQFTARREA